MKTLIFDLDDTLFDSSGQVFVNGESEIEVFENTFEALSVPDFTYILLTRGDQEYQNKKIDKLKIRDFFSSIYICDTDEGKHACLQEIYNTYDPKLSYVIGNRIDCEVRYGNMCGAQTVQYKHGKYLALKPQDEFEVATYEVESMSELRDLLHKLKTNI